MARKKRIFNADFEGPINNIDGLSLDQAENQGESIETTPEDPWNDIPNLGPIEDDNIVVPVDENPIPSDDPWSDIPNLGPIDGDNIVVPVDENPNNPFTPAPPEDPWNDIPNLGPIDEIPYDDPVIDDPDEEPNPVDGESGETSNDGTSDEAEDENSTSNSDEAEDENSTSNSDGEDVEAEETESPTVNEDGTIIMPNGTIIQPNGTVVTPEGKIVTPSGLVVTPDGQVFGPDGNSIGEPEVNIGPGDGSKPIFLPDGKVPLPVQDKDKIKDTGMWVNKDIFENIPGNDKHWVASKAGADAAAKLDEPASKYMASKAGADIKYDVKDGVKKVLAEHGVDVTEPTVDTIEVKPTMKKSLRPINDKSTDEFNLKSAPETPYSHFNESKGIPEAKPYIHFNEPKATPEPMPYKPFNQPKGTPDVMPIKNFPGSHIEMAPKDINKKDIPEGKPDVPVKRDGISKAARVEAEFGSISGKSTGEKSIQAGE